MTSKLTKRIVKDQLSTNFWTVLTVFLFAGLFRVLQAILGDRMTISLFNMDDPDWPHLDGASRVADPIVVAGVALAVVLMVIYVVSIVYASTTRTYLGAGVARRDFMKSQIAVWVVSALSIAIGCLVLAGVVGIARSDFSGTLSVEGTGYTSVLWYVPIAAFVAAILAHAVGFMTGMLFVRFPWWIGVGAILLYILTDTWTNSGLSSWGGFLDWQTTGGGSQLWKHVLAGSAHSVVFTCISWALLRRLSIRR